jgi:hypothetical protein
MIIPMETVLKIIKAERKEKARFTISDDMLMSAYDKIKWMVSVLPSPVTDDTFIAQTEQLALVWIKQEIEADQRKFIAKESKYFHSETIM